MGVFSPGVAREWVVRHGLRQVLKCHPAVHGAQQAGRPTRCSASPPSRQRQGGGVLFLCGAAAARSPAHTARDTSPVVLLIRWCALRPQERRQTERGTQTLAGDWPRQEKKKKKDAHGASCITTHGCVNRRARDAWWAEGGAGRVCQPPRGKARPPALRARGRIQARAPAPRRRGTQDTRLAPFISPAQRTGK